MGFSQTKLDAFVYLLSESNKSETSSAKLGNGNKNNGTIKKKRKH